MKTPYINTAPWIIDVNERIHEFKEAAKNKKRVLFLYEAADFATFRYQGYNVYQHLKQSLRWHMSYFFTKNEFDYIENLLPECDLLIICRLRWTQQLDTLIINAKKLGIPVLFDIDDLIFDLERLPEILDTVAAKVSYPFKMEGEYLEWYSLFDRLDKTASLAEGQKALQ